MVILNIYCYTITILSNNTIKQKQPTTSYEKKKLMGGGGERSWYVQFCTNKRVIIYPSVKEIMVMEETNCICFKAVTVRFLPAVVLWF